MTHNNKILNGPSKWSLSVAFFDLVNGKRRPVTFTVSGPDFNADEQEFEVVINSIQWEDGSGESWIFSGHALIHGQNRVSGWFETTTRKGWLVFEMLPGNKHATTAVDRQPDPHFVQLVSTLKKQRGQ